MIGIWAISIHLLLINQYYYDCSCASFFYRYMLLILLWIYSRVEMLALNLCLAFWGISRMFSNASPQFHLPTSSVWGSTLSPSLSTHAIVQLFYFNHSSTCVVILWFWSAFPYCWAHFLVLIDYLDSQILCSFLN